ncbi:methyltransferase [Xanthomonas vasicola]|uniref:major capsid protein n=1 Tax=Xanthomonas vasicola TaxID=56459 RepID=UPI000DE46082|nr:major capsid protein [Xanthomonas vasicola]RJN05313.1 methyltransferase [Xanthomonas vasicola]RJN09635.1 methyltransferase [Xanthomonas vasicola]RJN20210.1 methyltransferase [Xanthomonas vasicola]
MRNLKNLFKNKTAALAAVGSTALVSLPAFASGGASGGGGVDVGDVVAAIKAAAGPIAAIGGAVLTVLVGIKVYKWVRRAM